MAPELAYATMERGGVKTGGSGEQVREKAGDLAQEGTLGFNTSKLLEEREGYDLRVRELLEGLVVTSFGTEPVVIPFRSIDVIELPPPPLPTMSSR